MAPPSSYKMKKYHFISCVITECQSPPVCHWSEPKTSKEKDSASLVLVLCGGTLSWVAEEAQVLFYILALAEIASFPPSQLPKLRCIHFPKCMKNDVVFLCKTFWALFLEEIWALLPIGFPKIKFKRLSIGFETDLLQYYKKSKSISYINQVDCCCYLLLFLEV